MIAANSESRTACVHTRYLVERKRTTIRARYAPGLILSWVAALTLWGCSAGTRPGAQTGQNAPADNTPYAGNSGQPGRASIQNFTGIWKGSSTSSLTTAMVIITIKVGRSGNELTGTYQCESGNAVCYNQIRSGKIEGRSNSSSFQVILEDSTQCIYYPAADFSDIEGEGDYTCYNNGMLGDRGSWKLKRIDVLQPETHL